MFRSERYIKSPKLASPSSNRLKNNCYETLGSSNANAPATEKVFEWISRRRETFGLLSPRRLGTLKPLPNPSKVTFCSPSRPIGTKKVTASKGFKLLCDLYGPVPAKNSKSVEKLSTAKVDEFGELTKKPEQKEGSATFFDLTVLEETSKRMSRRGSFQPLKGNMLLRPPPLQTMKTAKALNSSVSDSSDSDSLSSDDDQQPILSSKLSSSGQHPMLKKSQTSVLPSLCFSRRFSLASQETGSPVDMLKSSS